MANENLIFPLEKKFIERQTVGGTLQYIRDERFKGGAIPLRVILEIVCKIALNGDCQFFELKYGPVNKPIKVIIDKGQYDDLMTLSNS
jgi:hypothetical protein